MRTAYRSSKCCWLGAAGRSLDLGIAVFHFVRFLSKGIPTAFLLSMIYYTVIMRNDDANGPGTKGHCLYGSDKWPCQSHDTRSPHQYARCWIPFSGTNLFNYIYIYIFLRSEYVRIIYCIPWDWLSQLNLSKSLPDSFKMFQGHATARNLNPITGPCPGEWIACSWDCESAKWETKGIQRK